MSDTRLRMLRQEKGWTQRRLAVRANLPEAEVSRIETGRMHPYRGQARRLARALGVRVEDLFPENLDPGGKTRSRTIAPGLELKAERTYGHAATVVSRDDVLPPNSQ